MRIKKAISLLLVISMLITMMAGCSGKKNDTKTSETSGTETGTEDQKGEGVTFPLSETANYSMFAIMNGEYDLKDNAALNYTAENANIKFDIQSVMGADLVEKRGIVLSSGEYPNIFFKAGLSLADLEKFGKQGIFIPLEDLIKQYAPNLSARLDEIKGWDYITSSDGHIYSLPELSRQNGAMTSYWINKKWMDNLGLKEPTNLEELYNVLKAFKDQDANGNGDTNDEIPITGTDVVKPDLLLAYFGIPYDYGTKCAVLDGKMTYMPVTDKYKEFISYVTKLYKEGIMDKNVFTQKHEQQGAIGQSGDVFGSFFDAGAFLTVGRDNDDDYILLTPFEDGLYPLTTGVTPGTLAITDNCPNPEVIIAWADQFYTEEGGILAWLGVEGKTWKKASDGTWEWIIGQGFGDDIAAVRSSNTIQGAANHPSIQPDYWFDGMSDKTDADERYLNGERAKAAAKGAVPLPMMYYTDNDMQTIATIKADVDAYIDQYLAQVATGELDLESSWSEYLSTLDAMGANQLQEIYQKTYEISIAK